MSHKRGTVIVVPVAEYEAQHEAVMDLQALAMRIGDTLGHLSARMDLRRQGNRYTPEAGHPADFVAWKKATASEIGPDAA